ncbi:hypothetical protein FQR65_LT12768 [Abscondita terminalis]|nr:hypothetical protein FQR65_LT12768 [Abscondita terminalis]
MVESFLDNNKNGSSIFQGKIREQDFSAEQKLNELKAAIEELDRQDLLRKAECERQASSCIDEISSQAELHIKDDDEGYFGCEKPLGDFWNFFESLFNLFEVDLDPQDYQMLKEKKEKNLIAAIMKFLRDKLKELVKKIFALDVSFDQRLDKEIKELQEKLGSGELSEEEFARALERLTALQDLKLKLQLAVVGWVVTMFAEIFGVELAAVAEASKEKEDKKAEKTSLKEEKNKEVRENVEIKMDEREKLAVPVSLFEVSPGFVRPVVLSKPEFDLLPEPLKIPMDLSYRQVINNENNKSSQESRVKVEERKLEEPKKQVCPPAPKTATETGQVIREPYGCNSGWGKMTEQNNNNTYQASSQSAQSFVSDKKASNQSTKSPVPNGKALNTQDSIIPSKDAPEQSARSSVADCECNFPVGFWKGAEHEGSVGDAQPPKGLTNDVKVEKCVEGPSVGKT